MTANNLLKEFRELASKLNELQLVSLPTELFKIFPFYVVGKGTKNIMSENNSGMVRKHGFEDVIIRNSKNVLLNTVDLKVYLALFRLWAKNGYRRVFTSSYYELVISTYGKTSGVKHYRKIKEAIGKLTETTYEINENKDERYLLKSFPTESESRVEFAFPEDISNAIIKGWTYTVSSHIFNEIRMDTSKNLYITLMALNKNHDDPSALELDVEKLINQLGISKFKQRLELSLKELKTFSIIQNFHFVDKNKRLIIEMEESAALSSSPTELKIIRNVGGNEGYVYFVTDKLSGAIKIGKAKNVEQRLSSYTNPVEELHTVKTNNHTLTEKLFHNHFSSKRISGEWFKLNESDINWIKSGVYNEEIMKSLI